MGSDCDKARVEGSRSQSLFCVSSSTMWRSFTVRPCMCDQIYVSIWDGQIVHTNSIAYDVS